MTTRRPTTRLLQQAGPTARRGCALVALAISAAWLGCASLAPQDRQPLPADPTSTQIEAYSDADWAAVLRRHVRDDGVDYASLASDVDVLDRFLAMVRVVSPTQTPQWFPTADDRVCYWINVHNAAAMRQALRDWQRQSPLEAVVRTLERFSRVAVDGRSMTFAQIQREALAAADGDARVLMALCDGTADSPRLAAMTYRAIDLDRRLALSARQAVGNVAAVSIDHARQALLLCPILYVHRQAIALWYERRFSVSGGGLLAPLLAMADAPTRQRLNTAIGYRVAASPRDGRLNIAPSTESTSEAP